MRSFTFVLLLALALAIAAFAPVASASANITLFIDSACTQPLGDTPATIPFPSSSTCRDVSTPTNTESIIFTCDASGGNNNLSFSAWPTTDCSGDMEGTITSSGAAGSCAAVVITLADGTQYLAYGQVVCFDQSHSHSGQRQLGQSTTFGELVQSVRAAQPAVIPEAKHGLQALMERLMAVRKQTA